MRQQLLVTAVGEDRPGIVAHLAEVITHHGANLEESRMAILGGEFAAIVLVSVADDKVEELVKDLDGLKKESISITTKKTKPLSADRFKNYRSYELILTGADHEGIVHRVATYLRDQGINIESLDTEVSAAPISGTPLFNLNAFVTAPPSLSIEDLRKHLDEIGQNESVDIELNESIESDKKADRVSLRR